MAYPSAPPAGIERKRVCLRWADRAEATPRPDEFKALLPALPCGTKVRYATEAFASIDRIPSRMPEAGSHLGFGEEQVPTPQRDSDGHVGHRILPSAPAIGQRCASPKGLSAATCASVAVGAASPEQAHAGPAQTGPAGLLRRHVRPRERLASQPAIDRRSTWQHSAHGLANAVSFDCNAAWLQ